MKPIEFINNIIIILVFFSGELNENFGDDLNKFKKSMCKALKHLSSKDETKSKILKFIYIDKDEKDENMDTNEIKSKSLTFISINKNQDMATNEIYFDSCTNVKDIHKFIEVCLCIYQLHQGTEMILIF